MPRGVRKPKIASAEERLEQLVSEIDAAKANLAKLKEEKAQIEKQIEAEKLSKLQDAIAKSGKSIDEVISLLN